MLRMNIINIFEARREMNLAGNGFTMTFGENLDGDLVFMTDTLNKTALKNSIDTLNLACTGYAQNQPATSLPVTEATATAPPPSTETSNIIATGTVTGTPSTNVEIVSSQPPPQNEIGLKLQNIPIEGVALAGLVVIAAATSAGVWLAHRIKSETAAQKVAEAAYEKKVRASLKEVPAYKAPRYFTQAEFDGRSAYEKSGRVSDMTDEQFHNKLSGGDKELTDITLRNIRTEEMLKIPKGLRDVYRQKVNKECKEVYETRGYRGGTFGEEWKDFQKRYAKFLDSLIYHPPSDPLE